jgi:hypothetical protein
MRGRIALQKHFVEIYVRGRSILRKPLERTRPRVAFIFVMS